MMNISERYRDLVAETRDLLLTLQEETPASEAAARELRALEDALQGLVELEEGVGEIPRIRLEVELTPVLLKAHNQIDRARLVLDEQQRAERVATAWELQQTIYRLLNDL